MHLWPPDSLSNGNAEPGCIGRAGLICEWPTNKCLELAQVRKPAARVAVNEAEPPSEWLQGLKHPLTMASWELEMEL